MGWAVRYKKEISSTKSDYAKPNCIPGYGYTTDDTNWGGTYSLIFDLNWGMKKSHKRGVKIEIRDIQPESEPTQEPNGTQPVHTQEDAQIPTEDGKEDGTTNKEE